MKILSSDKLAAEWIVKFFLVFGLKFRPNTMVLGANLHITAYEFRLTSPTYDKGNFINWWNKMIISSRIVGSLGGAEAEINY